MKEEAIKKLIDDLFSKKFTKKFSHSGDTHSSFLVDEQARTLAEDIIRNHLSENRDEKLGVLEAKVFMYEEIISKSNFAPLLPKEKSSE